jgi:hypothetical protein
MAYQALNPTTWVPYLPWIGVAYVIKDAQSSFFEGPYKLHATAVYLSIFSIASFWQSQVTKVVPEPYLVSLVLFQVFRAKQTRMRSSTYLKHRLTVSVTSISGTRNSPPLRAYTLLQRFLQIWVELGTAMSSHYDCSIPLLSS